MKVIVTGGAGFIGSAVVRALLQMQGVEIINLDKLTYAGNLESVSSVSGDGRYRFVHMDICEATGLKMLFDAEQPDASCIWLRNPMSIVPLMVR